MDAGGKYELVVVSTAQGSEAYLTSDFFVLSADTLTLRIEPRTLFRRGNCGGDYTVTIGEGTSPAQLGADNLSGVTVTNASGADYSPAMGTDYTARDGSIIITLSEAYLNRLPVGNYTLTAHISGGIYDGQTPSGSFRVEKGGNVPITGDSSSPLLWAGLLALAGAGLALIALKKRRAKTE